MPEPADSLHERLVAASGLATLVDEARATWAARAGLDDGASSGEDAAVSGGPADGEAADGESAGDAAEAVSPDGTEAVADGAERAHDAEGSRPAGDQQTAARRRTTPRRPQSPPRWRAFEDAFPTFYQFTNRPRG
jgi:hypothetical protein